MFRDKNFLIEMIHIGKKSREDTCLLLGILYDEIKDNGATDEVIGKYLFLKRYINEHRELINNKDYDIIMLPTFLQRINLILKRYNKDILDIEDMKLIVDKVNNNEIKEIKVNINNDIIEEKEESNIDINKCTGIYGIYIDDRLVYIGRTVTSFKTRFERHVVGLKYDNTYLYNKLREYRNAGCVVSLRPLIVLEQLEVENKRKFSTNDVNCMELALITALKPELNIEGKLKPYVFRK